MLDDQKKMPLHHWHPCAQMKDYSHYPSLEIKSASGSYLECVDGTKIIDAISSWWCKSLGHGHPQLKKALIQQVNQFEHVLFAHTTHDTINQLSQMLVSLMPHLKKVFYAGDGASAVEIAMKMSVHKHKLEGKVHKTKFIALEHSYHGETCGALSVTHIKAYRAPYQSMLQEACFIESFYVFNQQAPGWHDAEMHWQAILPHLKRLVATTTAIIIEPMIQGAGGMRLISKDFLYRLSNFAQAHDIHVIADEIMTGLGRTGKMLACEHANIKPDFICLGKGLTSGWVPFSAVLTTDDIYDVFYGEDKSKAFLHSHTYSGNALGASLALATIQIIQKEKLCERAQYLQIMMQSHMQAIADQTGVLCNLRGIGAIMAADFIADHGISRLDFKFFQVAIENGAYIRPIGNTLYWMPPLNVSEATLLELKQATLQTIKYLFSV